MNYLAEKGVPSMIYYPLPVHEQEAFKPVTRISGSVENAEKLCKSVLSLPMHTELTPDIEDYIIESVKSYF